MKREVPTWVAVLIIVAVLAIAGFWLYKSTARSSSDVVVEQTFGSESDPYGKQGAPTATPRAGTGASSP